MKKNMGTLDKSLRIIVALVIIALYFLNVISGTLAIVLLVIAGVFIAVSFLGYCPLYSVFGFNTLKKNNQ